MNTPHLKFLGETNGQVLGLNTAGITQEESLISPKPAGNAANWVVAHLVHYRNVQLKSMGADPVWEEAQGKRFARSSAPLNAGEAPPDFADLLGKYNRSQETILKLLPGLSTEQLNAKAGDQTLGELLFFLQYHECYHIGQLGLLRRVIGKEGALK